MTPATAIAIVTLDILGSAASISPVSVGAEVHRNDKTKIKSGIRSNLPVLAELVNVYGSAQTALFYGIVPQNEAKLGLNVLGIKADVTISRLPSTALDEQQRKLEALRQRTDDLAETNKLDHEKISRDTQNAISQAMAAIVSHVREIIRFFDWFVVDKLHETR